MDQKYMKWLGRKSEFGKAAPDTRLIALLLALALTCTALAKDSTEEEIEFESSKMVVDLPTKCPIPRISREALAKNLSQYDASNDPRSDIRDDAPWSQTEIDEIKQQLVEDGFVYPSGDESVITWMDFDIDGNCDFGVTVGIGGNRSIERMMLFRGLGRGKFKLVDSHLSFMDTAITLIPYIPVRVKGEKLPIIILPRDGRMLRWRNEETGFEKCDARLDYDHPYYIENGSGPAFERLCKYYWFVAPQAEQRLPEKNEIPSWTRR